MLAASNRIFQEIMLRWIMTDRPVREVHEVQGWQPATEKALQLVAPGDLLVIQADVIEETMEFLKLHLVTDASSREIGLKEAVHAADEAVQIHGGYGYIEEYPVCRFYRDAKILTIGEGTDEVQEMVIARALGA